MSFKVSDYINLAKRKLHFKGVINEGQVQNGIFFFLRPPFVLILEQVVARWWEAELQERTVRLRTGFCLLVNLRSVDLIA